MKLDNLRPSICDIISIQEIGWLIAWDSCLHSVGHWLNNQNDEKMKLMKSHTQDMSCFHRIERARNSCPLYHHQWSTRKHRRRKNYAKQINGNWRGPARRNWLLTQLFHCSEMVMISMNNWKFSNSPFNANAKSTESVTLVFFFITISLYLDYLFVSWDNTLCNMKKKKEIPKYLPLEWSQNILKVFLFESFWKLFFFIFLCFCFCFISSQSKAT